MKALAILSVVLLITGCATKDDALYAPWNSVITDDGITTEAESLDMVINNNVSVDEDGNELCVTKLRRPYEQACTKEVNL